MDLFRESLRFTEKNMGQNMEENMEKNLERDLERNLEKDATNENSEKETIQKMIEYEREKERQYNTYKMLMELKELGENVAQSLETVRNKIKELVENAIEENLISQEEKESTYERFGIKDLKKQETKKASEEQER